MKVELILNDLELDELQNILTAIGKRAYSEAEIAMLLYKSGVFRNFIRTVGTAVKEVK